MLGLTRREIGFSVLVGWLLLLLGLVSLNCGRVTKQRDALLQTIQTLKVTTHEIKTIKRKDETEIDVIDSQAVSNTHKISKVHSVEIRGGGTRYIGGGYDLLSKQYNGTVGLDILGPVSCFLSISQNSLRVEGLLRF